MECRNYFRYIFCFIILIKAASSSGQSLVPLYQEGKVPNSIPVRTLNDTIIVSNPSTGRDTMFLVPKTIMPTLKVFQPAPDMQTGMAVIICSGGSYRWVADMGEGVPAAQVLAKVGITAFVLHYRVPRSDMMLHKENVPMQDLQRAIQFVREHAEEYHINKSSVGVMGFSAAGHIVSSVCTHLHDIYIKNPDSTNLRPDFMVLVYPVISFADSLTHFESRANLVGPDITPVKILDCSNELWVSRETPPAFIIHSIDDPIVKVENSLYFAAALEQNKVPEKLFLYAKGGHGFGIYNQTCDIQWIEACIQWIKTRQWTSK